MKIVGLTGNSGAGKTTVCEILKKRYNVEIIDADKVAKQLTNGKTPYLKHIVEKFGIEILDEAMNLNRKKLANIIYNDNKKREELNEITFIHVVDEIKNRINELEDSKIVVIDAPLLFESNLNEICDITIGIIAKDNIKLDRICKRDSIDKQTAQKRIDIQLKNEYLYENADYIIENDSSMEELENKIEELHIF